MPASASTYTGGVERITRFLLGALVFTLPFDQAFRIGAVGSLSRTVGLLAAVAAVLALVARPSVRIRRLPVYFFCAVAFVGLNAVSVLWTIDRNATISQAFTYVQLLLLVWLLWQFVETPQQARGLRQAYVLGTWVTIGTVAWGFVTHNPTIDPTRFTAFDTNANYTAQSIALALPMAFAMALRGPALARLSAVLLIPASLYGIALTGSRSGGIIAVFALVCCVVFLVRRSAAVKAAPLSSAAIVIAVLAVALPQDTIRRFSGTVDQVESADFSGRGQIWLAGLEAWLVRPALGAGSGTFEEALVSTLGYGRAAHNSFLALLVELGPIGATLFLLLFVVGLWPHVLVLSRRGGASPEALRTATLHMILFATLFLTQLPANWQYQRVTWYILSAAMLDGALFLRSARAAASGLPSAPAGVASAR